MTDIQKQFEERTMLWQTIGRSDLDRFIRVAVLHIGRALKGGKKVLIFGNGGSAAEAQHFAAELVGRFECNRRGLAVVALTTDSSIITAQANDVGYETIFSRQIEALARPGDVVIGMTTSDVASNHSANILQAFQAAKKAKAYRIGFVSIRTKKLLRHIDLALKIPATNTALIQEMHLAILHIISKLIESGETSQDF